MMGDILYYLIVIAAVLLIRRYVFNITRVQGKSMLPTLKSGQWFLVWRWPYLFHPPKRGDVVICCFPGRKVKHLPFLHQPMVKRIIALPGGTIAIHEGQVFIGGEALEETYLSPAHCRFVRDMAEITLQNDEYFVMGDHRSVSLDSRRVGPIHRKMVLGRLSVRLIPPGKGPNCYIRRLPPQG